MRVLVTGGGGQLARAISRRSTLRGIDVISLGRDSLDITVPAQIASVLAHHRPSVVIDTASFTHVDRAETERARAHAVNTLGAANVATACADRGTPLIHLSTDYVFDGTSTRPYHEGHTVTPLNVYGETKAEGERAVLDAGGTVVRTAWLFGHGGPSFVHAIARRALEQPVLHVVADQRGNPTWTDDLADALLQLAADNPRAGLLHVCGDEPTTRHAFAEAIVQELRRFRAVACERIEPISTAEMPAPARRPAYSVLNTQRARSLGLPLRSWRSGLRDVLASELGAP
jgi:dTDP-4-dehydrorhamnose reductase